MSKDKVIANMLNMLVSTIGGNLKDVKPENNLAQFVDNNISIIFKFPESSATDEFGFMTDIIKKVFILSANKDPRQTFDNFNEFAKVFQEWFEENTDL